MAPIPMRRLTLVAGLLSTLAALLVVTSTVMGRGARRSGFSGRAELMQAEVRAYSCNNEHAVYLCGGRVHAMITSVC